MISEKNKKQLLLDIDAFLSRDVIPESLLFDSFYYLLNIPHYDNLKKIVLYMFNKNIHIYIDRDEDKVVKFLASVMDDVKTYRFNDNDFYKYCYFFNIKLNEKCMSLIEVLLEDCKYDISLFGLFHKYSFSVLIDMYYNDDVIRFSKLQDRFIRCEKTYVVRSCIQSDSVKIFDYFYKLGYLKEFKVTCYDLYVDYAVNLLLYFIKNGLCKVDDYLFYVLKEDIMLKSHPCFNREFIKKILPFSGPYFDRLYDLLKDS